MSDPAAISAFSALLSRHEPSHIADRLAEVVRIALHLDVAYVSLRDQGGVHEAIHVAPAFTGARPTWQHLLIQWARRSPDPSDSPPSEENGLRFILRPIGPDAEWGFIGAACGRPEFPTMLNTMLLEFIAQFTGSVVREQHETEIRPPVKTYAAALGLLNSLMTQAKRQRGPDTIIPLHRLHARLSMTPEELKLSLKTLRLSQLQLARCISVSRAAVKKWCQGRARIPGPAVLIIKLMLESRTPNLNA
ncbi:MAG: hypothetical protein ABI945_02860 [Nitrospirales bacterium]